MFEHFISKYLKVNFNIRPSPTITINDSTTVQVRHCLNATLSREFLIVRVCAIKNSLVNTHSIHPISFGMNTRERNGCHAL